MTSIQAQVLELLRSVVLEPEQGSMKTRLLAAAILADLCPNPHILVRDFELPVELRFVPLIMATFLAQVRYLHLQIKMICKVQMSEEKYSFVLGRSNSKLAV